jgi:hypothetical protein
MQCMAGRKADRKTDRRTVLRGLADAEAPVVGGGRSRLGHARVPVDGKLSVPEHGCCWVEMTVPMWARVELGRMQVIHLPRDDEKWSTKGEESTNSTRLDVVNS